MGGKMERRAVASSSELEEYRKFLAASVESGKIIVNRDGGGQTAIVIATLFGLSRQQLDFLIPSLDPQIFGLAEVTSAATEFLSEHPGARVRVLTESPVTGRHVFLDSLKRAGVLDRVQILEVPDELQAQYNYWLIIADGKHFRFVPSRDSSEAYVKFGDPNVAKQLQSVFDTLHDLVAKAGSRLHFHQPA
jgi:hypothetical protein